MHETRTLDDLEGVARAIAARGTDSASCSRAATARTWRASARSPRVRRARPCRPSALAPGGTVCTVARNLGMRGRARASYARACVRRRREGTGARRGRRPTLRVRDDAGGDRVGFIFGAGLVVRFFDAYYAGAAPGARRGREHRGAHLRGVARRLAPSRGSVLDPTAVSLRVDGDAHATRAWSLVLASVVRDVGLHMLVPYRAGEAMDRFHLVASGLSPRALGAQLPRVLAGRPLAGEPARRRARTLVRVSFEGETRRLRPRRRRVRARAVKVEAGPVLSLLRL